MTGHQYKTGCQQRSSFYIKPHRTKSFRVGFFGASEDKFRDYFYAQMIRQNQDLTQYQRKMPCARGEAQGIDGGIHFSQLIERIDCQIPGEREQSLFRVLERL